MAKAIEAGIPKLRIEEAAARTQARIDAGAAVGDRRQQVPARRAKRRSTCSRSTTPPCAQLQLDKLDAAAAPSAIRRQSTAALDALTRGADGGNGNLLALAVDAARAKATVGEISMALEKVCGRHRAEIKSITGVYKREVGMTDAVERVREAGRRRSRPTKAAARASWSPRSARTATTAARR